MGLFDFFDSSWKKEFEELLVSHKDAVESYIKKKYKVYGDMRSDDKALIADYLSTYEKYFLPLTVFIEPIEVLSKEAKKYIVQRRNEVLRLYLVFSNYSTPQKRVLSLYNRFKRDDMFDKVFGEYLGSDYDINNLDNEQVSYILDNYQSLYVYSSTLREENVQKQKILRTRLKERAHERKIKGLILRQQQSSEEIVLPFEHGELSAKLKTLVDNLSIDYNADEVFVRVCKSLYSNFTSTYSLTDAQYVNILAHKNELEKEKEFFAMLHHASGDASAYRSFLKDNSLVDNHSGILYCLEHFLELQLYMMSYQHIVRIQEWIDLQKVVNEKGAFLAGTHLSSFTCRTVKMYIDISDVNDGVRKVLPFNHYSLKDYTYEELSTTEMGAHYSYVYYNKERAEEAMNSTITIGNHLLTNISTFVFNLMTQMAVGGVIVVLGTSGASDVERYNNYHFWSLKDKLDTHNIECVNLNQLNKNNIKKHVIIVEMVTEVERFRETCKSISQNYPGSTLSYISLYSELTRKQLAKIRDR